MAKEKVDRSTSSDSGKPAKNLTKVGKNRKKNVTKSMMVGEIVKNIVTNWAGSEGISMAGIKARFIKESFIVLDKSLVTMIKKFLGKAFREGQIVMTNDDRTDKINYTKRFAMADMDGETSDVSEEE